MIHLKTDTAQKKMQLRHGGQTAAWLQDACDLSHLQTSLWLGI